MPNKISSAEFKESRRKYVDAYSIVAKSNRAGTLESWWYGLTLLLVQRLFRDLNIYIVPQMEFGENVETPVKNFNSKMTPDFAAVLVVNDHFDDHIDKDNNSEEDLDGDFSEEDSDSDDDDNGDEEVRTNGSEEEEGDDDNDNGWDPPFYGQLYESKINLTSSLVEVKAVTAPYVKARTMAENRKLTKLRSHHKAKHSTFIPMPNIPNYPVDGPRQLSESPSIRARKHRDRDADTSPTLKSPSRKRQKMEAWLPDNEKEISDIPAEASQRKRSGNLFLLEIQEAEALKSEALKSEAKDSPTKACDDIDSSIPTEGIQVSRRESNRKVVNSGRTRKGKIRRSRTYKSALSTEGLPPHGMIEYEDDLEGTLLGDAMLNAQAQLEEQAKRAMAEDKKVMNLVLIAVVGPWWGYFEVNRKETVDPADGMLPEIIVSSFEIGGLLGTRESAMKEEELREILRGKVNEILKKNLKEVD